MEMTSFLGIMVLLTGSILMTGGSLLEFGKLIKALTGKSAFPHYTAYGCHCGLGGKGQAIDATDRCCLAHDCCYERLSKCNTKTDRYRFAYANGAIECGQGSWCEMEVCQCDKAAALCLRKNLNSYNEKWRFYLDSRCKGTRGQC